MDQKLQKNFFLISFLPAIAYWYLEANYPLKIAITGGLILAILEIACEKYFAKHIHTLSKFNFFLILFLGAISLIGEEGIWFKLQPAFTGVGIGFFLIYRLRVGRGMMLEMMEQMNGAAKLPEFIITKLEWHISFLFLCYGIFMGFIATLGTTDQWLFFKTIGFYLVFIIFMFLEFFVIKRSMRKREELLRKQEIFKRF